MRSKLKLISSLFVVVSLSACTSTPDSGMSSASSAGASSGYGSSSTSGLGGSGSFSSLPLDAGSLSGGGVAGQVGSKTIYFDFLTSGLIVTVLDIINVFKYIESDHILSKTIYNCSNLYYLLQQCKIYDLNESLCDFLQIDTRIIDYHHLLNIGAPQESAISEFISDAYIKLFHYKVPRKFMDSLNDINESARVLTLVDRVISDSLLPKDVKEYTSDDGKTYIRVEEVLYHLTQNRAIYTKEHKKKLRSVFVFLKTSPIKFSRHASLQKSSEKTSSLGKIKPKGKSYSIDHYDKEHINYLSAAIFCIVSLKWPELFK